MSTAGHIVGELVLLVSDAEVNIGRVSLPLMVTRVSPEKSPYMHLGLGVDLEMVRDQVAELFAQATLAEPITDTAESE